MSLILGIIHVEEAHRDSIVIDRMYAPLKDFPQEKFHKIEHDEAAFGKILNYGTPEDVYDQMPVYLSEQNILFTAEGRIDNREELARNLNLSKTETLSDSYFMLQAYLKYGEEVQHKLKGDWSLAVYNFNSKDLFIARDTMGYTAIYFYQTKQYFAFSSSIKSILNLPDFKKQLNEEYFVSALTLWIPTGKEENNETIFQNIFYVRNGHTLQLKDRKIIHSKYWPPENIIEKHYKNKQDYADEMLELMYNAVSVRLRSYKPVASMLSGGLDSSTISYIAADLLKQQNKSLTTFSHVPLFKKELQYHPLAKKRVLDETPYINAVVETSGNINPQFLNSEQISPLQGMNECMLINDGVIHAAANAYWLIDIFKTCAQQGYGTLLTGEGGNGSISFAGVDYLRPFQFSTFISNPYLYFKKQVAKPFALKHLTNWINYIKRASTLENYIINGYLSKEIQAKYNIIDDIRKNRKESLIYTEEIISLKRRFINLYQMRSWFGANFKHYYGVEMRDPTSDIDVMNYFLTIPNEIFFNKFYGNRVLVKNMMKTKLPDSVLFARKNGLQSADIGFRIKSHQEELLYSVCKLKDIELINQTKFISDFKTFISQKHLQPYQSQHLLKPLHFSLFLQKYFG